MTKKELISAISQKTKMTKKDSGIFLDAFTDVVSGTLASGEEVKVVGFGTFKVRKRSARIARNPKTGAPAMVCEGVYPVFVAGSELKECVSGEKLVV